MDKKRAKYAFLAIVAILVAAYATAPHIAKKVVVRELAARGWTTSMESVRVKWAELDIRGMTMSSEDGSKNARFESVKVDLDVRARPEAITAVGGRIEILGPWKRSGAAAPKAKTEIYIRDVSASWKNADGAGAFVDAKSVSADYSSGKASIDVKGWSVESKWGSASGESAKIVKDNAGARASVPSLQAIVKDKSIGVGGLVVTKLAATDKTAEISIQADEMQLPWGLSASGLRLDAGAVLDGRLELEVKMMAASFSGQHGKVAPDSVSASLFSIDGTLRASGAEDWDILATIGVAEVSARIGVHGSSKGWSAWAVMDSTPCGKLLNAMPEAMRQELSGMELDGEIGGKVSVSEFSAIEADFSLDNRCKVTKIPDQMALALSGKPFKRMVYASDGKPKETTSGIEWGLWAPLQSISPYMAKAVVTTEDPSFWNHHGIDADAIRNSIRDNVRDRKFTRGASTITMQLAKNLFLSREKTASRKIQEFFLTMALDQKLTREKILEAYLNVVEFGPNVYGVKAASRYYFETEPSRLSLAQSVFLASILPRPRAQYFNADRKLHESKRRTINLILDLMLRRRSITDEECRMGKEEELVFGKADAEPSERMDASEWTMP